MREKARKSLCGWLEKDKIIYCKKAKNVKE